MVMDRPIDMHLQLVTVITISLYIELAMLNLWTSKPKLHWELRLEIDKVNQYWYYAVCYNTEDKTYTIAHNALVYA